MRFLRQNTATLVTVGPFYDKTDGVTIENALTITNEKITLVVDANDGSAPTLVLDNVTGATSGTDNDLNYITNCDAGLMQLELSAANTNYVGRAMLTITDAANHAPVFHEFTLFPAPVYDSLIANTDKLPVDVSEISSDATAADNLEAACDGGTFNVGGGAVVAASVGAGGITAASIATGAIDADALAADAVDEILDEVVEGSLTLRQTLRILLAALAGKAAGGGTTAVTFRDVADAKDRIAATVDTSGNRSAVTLDGS